MALPANDCDQTNGIGKLRVLTLSSCAEVSVGADCGAFHESFGDMLAMVLTEQRRTNRMLAFLTCMAAGFGVGLVALYLL